jgi:hypothetical protein
MIWRRVERALQLARKNAELRFAKQNKSDRHLQTPGRQDDGIDRA